MSQTDWIVLVIIIVALGVSLLVILPWRMKRAMRLVIKAFVENNATSPKNAIEREKLKIKPPPGLLSWKLKPRDFKHEALNLLQQTGVVLATEDGRLYLEEERIDFSKLGKSRAYYRGG